jgi:hypothetical protein
VNLLTFFFSFAELEMKPRALSMLGKYPTTELPPQQLWHFCSPGK